LRKNRPVAPSEDVGTRTLGTLSWALAVTLTASLGCGSSESRNLPDSAAGGSDGGVGGIGGFSGGGGTSGGGGSAGSDASAPTLSASVYVQSDTWQGVVGDGGVTLNERTYASATFPSLPTCTTQTVMGCSVRICDDTGGPDAGADMPMSAGVIHISIAGGVVATLSPEADGSYQPLHGTQSFWNGGEAVTVQSAGGQVPAFTGVLAAPVRLTVTAPVLPAPGTRLAIPHGQPLQVSWTGQSDGSLQVQVVTSDNHHTATCRFPVSAGTGSVPPEVLALLPLAEATLVIRGINGVPVRAGDWTVHLATVGTELAPDGQSTRNIAAVIQ
jgi:hypothetical protein